MIAGPLSKLFGGAIMSVSQWLYLVLLSVLSGGSLFFVGAAVHDVPAFTLVFFRVALAALFFSGRSF